MRCEDNRLKILFDCFVICIPFRNEEHLLSLNGMNGPPITSATNENVQFLIGTKEILCSKCLSPVMIMKRKPAMLATWSFSFFFLLYSALVVVVVIAISFTWIVCVTDKQLVASVNCFAVRTMSCRLCVTSNSGTKAEIKWFCHKCFSVDDINRICFFLLCLSFLSSSTRLLFGSHRAHNGFRSFCSWGITKSVTSTDKQRWKTEWKKEP